MSEQQVQVQDDEIIEWYNEPVFRAYAFYSMILIFKMQSMSFYTGTVRIIRKVIANPEDVKMNEKAEIKFNDEKVERIRRGHQNDLENITLFYIAGFLFALTRPNKFIGINMYRVYVSSRIIHTFVYTVFPMQPWRTLVWNVGVSIVIFMCISVMINFASLTNL